MENIFTMENLELAVEHLFAKSDSCGVDGICISQYKEYFSLNDVHFEKDENGATLLNKVGKKLFIKELERKLYQKVSQPKEHLSKFVDKSGKVHKMGIFRNRFLGG